MNEDHLWAELRAERREQVELLAALRPEQWDAATLCEGWRVREVVAHTTLPFRSSFGRTVVELLKARGSIDRMADRCARPTPPTFPPSASSGRCGTTSGTAGHHRVAACTAHSRTT
ncbi:maleylpyruvate isomerase N-terminal domain-containing protein [Plantactinospora sp. DSM 117369]